MAERTYTKNRNIKPSIIEWSAFLLIACLLYATGLHTPVIGTLQRGLLATGLIKPDIPDQIDNAETANLDLYFKNREGSVLSLNNFEGNVIFLNIWATWCPPCIAEMPSIYSLFDEFRDDERVSFVLVSMDEDFEKAKSFMDKRGYDLPIYHYRTKAAGTYTSNVIPTTYIISPASEIVLTKKGFAKYDTEEFRFFLLELRQIQIEE